MTACDRPCHTRPRCDFPEAAGPTSSALGWGQADGGCVGLADQKIVGTGFGPMGKIERELDRRLSSPIAGIGRIRVVAAIARRRHDD